MCPSIMQKEFLERKTGAKQNLNFFTKLNKKLQRKRDELGKQ